MNDTLPIRTTSKRYKRRFRSQKPVIRVTSSIYADIAKESWKGMEDSYLRIAKVRPGPNLEMQAGNTYLQHVTDSACELKVNVVWSGIQKLDLVFQKFANLEDESRGVIKIKRLKWYRFAFWVQKVRSFGDLETGWDTYEAEAPTPVAIETAINLLSALRKLEGTVQYVLPTSEQSILLKCAVEDTTFVWEVGSDGEVGVKVEKEGRGGTFHDVERNSFADFLRTTVANG